MYYILRVEYLFIDSLYFKLHKYRYLIILLYNKYQYLNKYIAYLKYHRKNCLDICWMNIFVNLVENILWRI